ncbi:MAG: Short chain dehydrogenase [Chloroflexi bacterium]|nr:Short chain dehydrogenase [Chloroflexota bacterium]
MDLGLKGKVAIVTGGSSGIGLATAGLLLAEGARVAICARGEERLQAALLKLQAEYVDAEVMAMPCNVLDEKEVQQLAQAVIQRWGGVDILVNNAGRGRQSTFKDTTDEAWKEELNLKFFSLIYPIRAVYSSMKERAGGRIININAILGRQPEPHMVATSAARSGVLNLTKSLSTEFAPDNILVNCINVGTINSGQWGLRYQKYLQAGGTLPEEEWLHQEASKRYIPLGRVGLPEEVGHAIVFLASAGASYITGASLDVDGGTGRYV